ncbi:hypothetical protein RV14_GL002056 [Enterococcus ratti]|uniref:Transposase n=1 Tax=Enterococcus ratti TaxID=150033 RepID=A0A1L8W585_9ENTE|nr:hypothetical protein RV14_GL002056 [Enterococcus ratti]
MNPLEAKKQLDRGLRVLKTDKQDAHRFAQSHGHMNGKTRDISQPFMKNPMI